MTDKVQKIRDEVERIQLYTQSEVLKQVLDYIDKVQEEPVSSIWHDARKTVPENSMSQILCYRENEQSIVTIGKIANGTVRWAYIENLLNKKEEPVSEDLEEAVNSYIGYKPEVDESSSVYGKRQAFKAGAQWKKERLIDRACEWLQEQEEFIGISFQEDFIERFKEAMED